MTVFWLIFSVVMVCITIYQLANSDENRGTNGFFLCWFLGGVIENAGKLLGLDLGS